MSASFRALGLAVLFIAGCNASQPTYPDVPPLPAETIPLPPATETPLIWRPGDWVMSDGSFRYEAGEYIPADGHSGLWAYGHWRAMEKGYVWVPGDWR